MTTGQDILERLRNTSTLHGRTWPELTDEAATEITRLREALASRDAEIAAWLRGGAAYLAYGSICEAIATAIASGQYRKDEA